jgi:hypothetical protein
MMLSTFVTECPRALGARARSSVASCRRRWARTHRLADRIVAFVQTSRRPFHSLSGALRLGLPLRCGVSGRVGRSPGLGWWKSSRSTSCLGGFSLGSSSRQDAPIPDRSLRATHVRGRIYQATKFFRRRRGEELAMISDGTAKGRFSRTHSMLGVSAQAETGSPRSLQ